MAKKQTKNIYDTELAELTPDNLNFNKGTQYGEHLMDNSIRKFGLGRSILIDKNDRIIAGNKTAEKAGELGLTKVLVVETDGDTLVAVKRTDVDLDTKEGRELALADNATSAVNLAWDEDALAQCAEEFSIDPDTWGVKLEEFNISPNQFGEEFSLNDGDRSPFRQMTFTLSANQAEEVKQAITEVLNRYGGELNEVDGNTNHNGNALAKIVQIWQE